MSSIDAYIKNMSAGEVGGVLFIALIVIVVLLLFITWLGSWGNGH